MSYFFILFHKEKNLMLIKVRVILDTLKIFFKTKKYSWEHSSNLLNCNMGENKKIINPCGVFSFGANSPFSNFLKYKVKFLNIGIEWKNTCTYLHHIEHLNGINHRFYKLQKEKL